MPEESFFLVLPILFIPDAETYITYSNQVAKGRVKP